MPQPLSSQTQKAALLPLFALLAQALLSRSSAASLPPAVAVRFLAGGAYAVDVGGAPWFESGDLALLVGGYVYSAAAGGLVVASNSTSAGADAIGAYANTTVRWLTVGGASPGVPLVTSFVVYANGAALHFGAELPLGAASQLPPPASPPLGGLALTFPSLQLTDWALATLRLGSVFQPPNSGNCGWTVNALEGFPIPSGALLVLEPLNASAPRAAVGVAALTGQTVVRQAAVGAALALGPGAEFELAPGFAARTLLVAVAAASAAPPTLPPAASAADLGFPVGGPGAALRLLGDALLAYRAKPRPAMNADAIHAGLGVSTTTFYFYDPCDCGRFANNTCPPDDGSNPGRVPDCMNYADTLERVAKSWRDADIPFTHMLLDSFWYGEGVYNGASMWEDDAALMEAVQSFPKSLAAFSDAIGRDVSIWAHNGHFVASSPYTSRYPFKALMPQGPEMWRYLFAANAKDFQLRRIKQDHVGETIASVGTITDPDLIASWWGGMGVAAAESGISIEYCCSPPLVLFDSLNVPAADGARSSPDYVLVGEHDGTPRTTFQWANGAESAFHFAIGLMPDKDGFMSNSSEMQQAWKHVPAANAPPFFNYTEKSAVRHATAALLCGGPVHVGDAVGATNATLVRALMRADGLLLRASRPHAALDVQFRSMATRSWGAPPEGEMLHAPAPAPAAAPPPPAGKPDESFPNNGLGEVYGAVTIVPSGPAPGACARFTVVTSTGLSQPLSLGAADLALDASALAAAACTVGGVALAAFAWDLETFAPAAGTPAAARRIFTGGGGAADALALAWTPAPRYEDPPQMVVVAPLLEGWVLLGEVGKLLPLSPQRLASLAPVAGSPGAVAVGLVGGISEVVAIAACRIEDADAACNGAASVFACTLSSDTPLGYATLTLAADGSGSCS